MRGPGSPAFRVAAPVCARLWRKIPAERPVHLPVNAVLSGRQEYAVVTQSIRLLARFRLTFWAWFIS
jgi:hypothetical protein